MMDRNRRVAPPTGLVILGVCVLAACGGERAEAPFRVYVTNETSGDLSVIDGGTNNVLATVPLGKRPRGMDVSRDRLYIALSGSPMAPPGVDESTLPPPDRKSDGIGVFDLRANRLLKILPGGTDPEQVAVDRDGARIYVANEDAAMASVVDVAAGRVVATIPVGEEPEGVTLSPDGKFVYVTSEDDAEVSVISTATNEAVKRLKVGLRPRAVAFLPDGSRAYVSEENSGSVSVIDAVRHEVIGGIQLGGEEVKPMGIAVAPDADAVVGDTTSFRIIDCPRCGGMLKPDIVYFGENVPKDRVEQAYSLLDDAEALLVAGSSLTVYSGYRFVRHSAALRIPVAIVNRGPTRGDDLATVKVDGGCSPILALLADELPAVANSA